MKFKNMIIILLVSIVISSSISAACGGCSADRVAKEKIQPRVNTLVLSVPDDGNINGLIITSCGKCNLGTKDKGCSLSVKVGEEIYPVKGTGIHDHGDAHGKEGFCSGVRVAWAKGKVKKNVFHAESFVLVGSEK